MYYRSTIDILAVLYSIHTSFRSVCLFDNLSPDSLIAVLWHFSSFLVIRLPVQVEFSEPFQAKLWCQEYDNWRCGKSAREPRSGNRTQRLCKNTNRCRVHTKIYFSSRAWRCTLITNSTFSLRVPSAVEWLYSQVSNHQNDGLTLH